MTPNAVAEKGAIIEANFHAIANTPRGHRFVCPRSEESFVVLDIGTFPDINGIHRPKAITVRDSNDNIFVHYNGTGDGFWHYNDVNYGVQPDPSALQRWSVEYFNRTAHGVGSGGGLFVTGHSQGGNNAKFVTLRSEYADRIAITVALDAPRFSHNSAAESRNMSDFEDRQNRIWAYNGNGDYVSAIGQENLVLDERTRLLQTMLCQKCNPRCLENNPNGKHMLYSYHAICGKLNENGRLMPYADEATPLREFVILVNGHILDLPQEHQARAAELLMAFMNYNSINEAMEPALFNEMVHLILPLLPTILAENPHMIPLVLAELGLDPALISIFDEALGDFNNLSLDDRLQVLEAIATLFVMEDGELRFEWRNLFTVETARAVLTLVPMLENMAENAISEFLRSHNVPPFIANFVARHGARIAGMALRIIAIGVLIFDGLRRAWDNFRNRAGRDYAAANPHIRLNTTHLRGYASRTSTVNNRINNLDGALRRLYWQVGFLDLWDIMVANLMTKESHTLNQVRNYLNNAADRFDAAERIARGHMGG